MPPHSIRDFPSPWTVKHIAGGFEVLDANGQSLAYVYGRETRADADTAALAGLIGATVGGVIVLLVWGAIAGRQRPVA